MAVRTRPQREFESTDQAKGRQTLTLSSLTGGYNGYTDPTLLSPQFWAAANNLYSGQFGTIRRARWAQIINSSTNGYAITGVRMTSLYGAYFPQQDPWLFFDTNMQIWKWDAITHVAVEVSLQVTSLFYLSAWNLNGPFMRLGIGGMIFQTNGQARSKIFTASGTPTLELDGIDAPDVAPTVNIQLVIAQTITAISSTANVVTVTLSASLPADYLPGNWVVVAGVTDGTFNSAAGTSFQITSINLGANQFTYTAIGTDRSSSSGTTTAGITTSVGRSYSYAWENANTGHVSAPSPASQYVALTSDNVTISCIQAGRIATHSGSIGIVGTNTAFTAAWVGRKLAIDTAAFTADPYVVSVQDATHLTISSAATGTFTNRIFVIYDPQVTHVRLYATGDGGAVYFRIARNSLSVVNGTLNVVAASFATSSGPYFFDDSNSEPPNAPFTNELPQLQNVPIPIGTFQDNYQGRRIVYGVPAAPQSFFYTNMEATVVGQPPESCAPLNEITLPISDGAINGTANLPTGMVFWSNRHDMFKLTGLLTDNVVANPQQLATSIQRLPYQIGNASPYAVCVTSLGSFNLSSDREVWLFTDHYAPKNVGKPIQDILNRATRIQFARMKNYKAGDRNWLALALSLDGSPFNNQLCLLDLDLLSSNGQPSFFTFDMATNQPSWYLYSVNCESLEASFDDNVTQTNSINHLLVGDVDKVTDIDWQPAYYTVSTELTVPSPAVTLHAIGNQDPEVIKTGVWLRALTNQIPRNLSQQNWSWNVLSYDDDKYIIGNNSNTTPCVPGVNNSSVVFGLEYSPALFKFGGVNVVKGRRFQINTQFPSTPGFWELKGFEFAYDPVYTG